MLVSLSLFYRNLVLLSLPALLDAAFPFENLRHSDSEQLFLYLLAGDTRQINTPYPLMCSYPSKNKHGFRQHDIDSAFCIVSSFSASYCLALSSPTLVHIHTEAQTLSSWHGGSS